MIKPLDSKAVQSYINIFFFLLNTHYHILNFVNLRGTIQIFDIEMNETLNMSFKAYHHYRLHENCCQKSKENVSSQLHLITKHDQQLNPPHNQTYTQGSGVPVMVLVNMKHYDTPGFKNKICECRLSRIEGVCVCSNSCVFFKGQLLQLLQRDGNCKLHDALLLPLLTI